MTKRMSKHIFLAFALCLLGCYPCLAQLTGPDTADRNYGKWLKKDIGRLFTNFDRRDLLFASSSAVVFASLVQYDRSVGSSIQGTHSRSGLLRVTNEFGNKKWLLPASAALFGGSLLTRNTKFRDAAFTSLESLVLSIATVNTAKFMFARYRPLNGEESGEFEFLDSGKTSFPSGHSANAFAFITPWILYYPHPVTYTLFALPAGTAVARIARGKHWLTDVTIGAAIGTAIAVSLTQRHQDRSAKGVNVTPVMGPDYASLSVSFRF